jgi:hypothetical protein
MDLAGCCCMHRSLHVDTTERLKRSRKREIEKEEEEE